MKLIKFKKKTPALFHQYQASNITIHHTVCTTDHMDSSKSIRSIYDNNNMNVIKYITCPRYWQ